MGEKSFLCFSWKWQKKEGLNPLKFHDKKKKKKKDKSHENLDDSMILVVLGLEVLFKKNI